MPTRNPTQRKKSLLAIAVILFLVIASGSLIAYPRVRVNKEAVQTADTNSPSFEKVDLSPPTEEDKQAVDQHKDALAKQQNEPAPSSSSSAKPIITDVGFYNGNVEIRSFITGVYEAGGTCTAELTKGSSKITRQVTATKGATTTDCPVIRIPRAELNAGTWTAQLIYNSSASTGTSEPRTVEVR